ncbi:MAG: hypothetical protein ACNYPH_01225 [Gammaproteobacteria bacterium WSBS_2016_MAG_OTU1]
MATLSATTQEISSELAPLLTKARRKPVALSRDGKTVAFVVNPRTMAKIEKIMEKAKEAEDNRFCLELVEKTKNSKNIGVKSARQ